MLVLLLRLGQPGSFGVAADVEFRAQKDCSGPGFGCDITVVACKPPRALCLADVYEVAWQGTDRKSREGDWGRPDLGSCSGKGSRRGVSRG